MENKEILELLRSFLDGRLVQIVLSGQTEKTEFQKLRLRPVQVGGALRFQAEEFRGTKAFHKNMDADAAAEYLCGLLGTAFRRAQLEARDRTASVLVSKKGKVTVKRHEKTAGDGREAAGTAKAVKKAETAESAVDLDAAWRGALSHNRKKNYILQEGVAVPFLIDLGVMTRDGRIVHARYDKFRQINRFLEFIEDVLPQLDRSRETSILDFGCGKSYLTFAMYYYLKELRGYPVRIIGLDLKADVIEKCNRLAEKYGYEGLNFYTGDIASYGGASEIDMVVTLHACDTATDYALEKAVRLGAKVILSVPCCQHELNAQMESELFAPVFRYGIVKERMAALFTDALRAQLLEAAGYRVQILEFIEMEHTPKNLLIRAVKRDGGKNTAETLNRPETAGNELPGKDGNVPLSGDRLRPAEAVMAELHVRPKLYELLFGAESKDRS